MQTASADPNVRIPAAARRAAARANELHKQAYKKAGDDKDTPDEGSTSDDEPNTDSAIAEPSPAPTDAAPAEPPSAPAPEPTEEEWRHRYASMKGRHDRMEQANTALVARVAELEAQMASLAARATTPQSEVDADTADSLITEQELQDYGEDFLTVVGKKAREIASSETKTLRQQLADVTKQLQDLGGTVAKSDRQKLFDSLDEQCASWREINSNPQFISWLQLPDTYSGAIRHDLLKAAFERNDSPRVLAFFKGFLAEEAAMDPASLAVDPTPAATAPGKVPLESLAAPGRAKTPAATTAPAEKPIIQRAQIAQFYADVANGKYKGKDAEKARFEKMIYEAQAEGRIR